MAHRAQVYPPNPGTEGKGRVGRDDCNEKKRTKKRVEWARALCAWVHHDPTRSKLVGPEKKEGTFASPISGSPLPPWRLPRWTGSDSIQPVPATHDSLFQSSPQGKNLETSNCLIYPVYYLRPKREPDHGILSQICERT